VTRPLVPKHVALLKTSSVSKYISSAKPELLSDPQVEINCVPAGANAGGGCTVSGGSVGDESSMLGGGCAGSPICIGPSGSEGGGTITGGSVGAIGSEGTGAGGATGVGGGAICSGSKNPAPENI